MTVIMTGMTMIFRAWMSPLILTVLNRDYNGGVLCSCLGVFVYGGTSHFRTQSGTDNDNDSCIGSGSGSSFPLLLLSMMRSNIPS